MTKPLLFVFLDGVGLGQADEKVNPFGIAQTKFLDSLLGASLSAGLKNIAKENFNFSQLDARLRVDGIPQSATGQASLLTGKNAAKLMGRHYGPWPGPTLKRLLDQGSIFADVLAIEKTAHLANVYPPGYFAALNNRKQKVNVPVYAVQAAGLSLQTTKDYAAGRAISADLSGKYLGQLDARLPVHPPKDMGKKLADLAKEFHFTFYDFWLTDSAGHRWAFADCVKLIEQLDEFFSGLVPSLGEVNLIVTSDHGNLEDKSVKSHTKNAVPLIAIGEIAKRLQDASSLLDIYPVMRDFLEAT